jgi:hypothetical protein
MMDRIDKSTENILCIPKILYILSDNSQDIQDIKDRQDR